MRIPGRLLLVCVLGLVVLAVGCSDDHHGNNGGNNGPNIDPGSIDVSKAKRCDFLDPSLCLYPFPNAYYTVSDATTPTGRRVNFSPKSTPVDKDGHRIDPTAWNYSDGFSPGSVLITKVAGLGTPEALAATGAPTVNHIGRSLQPDSPVVVLDATTGQRWPVWMEVDQAASLEDGDLTGPPPDPEDAAVLIYPAKGFIAGHRYIVALRDLKTADGKPIPASDAFQVYRDAVPSDVPAIEARRGHMKDIFRHLQNAGVDRGNLYLAWDFTVASQPNITGRMRSIRGRAFKALGDTDLADGEVKGNSPAFHVTNVVNYAPCADPDACQSGESERLLRKVEGTVRVPCYLDQRGCPAGSRFFYTDTSANRPARIPGNVIQAKFICIIPRAVKDRNGDVLPSRLSLYGHGLFLNPQEVTKGYVQDMANEHNMTFCATAWIGMATSDIGNTLGVLRNLSRFPELVDRTEQAMVDFMYLGRAMIHPQGLVSDPAFQVKNDQNELVAAIDTSHLYYDGNSLGGIFGGTLVALEPDLTRGVLGVPAMNFSVLLPRNFRFVGLFGPMLYSQYPERLQWPLVLDFMQMLWDRSDPDGYARYMTDNPLPGTPPHKVLMQAAWGDHGVSNWAANMEARTIGARRRAPTVDQERFNAPDGKPFFGIKPIENPPYAGSAIVYWDSGPVRDNANKGTAPPPLINVPGQKGQNPHRLPRKSMAARKQMSAFLKPHGKVINVCGSHPCYDGGYSGP